MLTAARSVIREVRGEATAKGRPAGRKRGRRATPDDAAEAERTADSGSAGYQDDSSHEDAGWQTGDDTGHSDESDGHVDPAEDDADAAADPPQRRKLSKAERRRLRKLARMNGEAA